MFIPIRIHRGAAHGRPSARGVLLSALLLLVRGLRGDHLPLEDAVVVAAGGIDVLALSVRLDRLHLARVRLELVRAAGGGVRVAAEPHDAVVVRAGADRDVPNEREVRHRRVAVARGQHLVRRGDRVLRPPAVGVRVRLGLLARPPPLEVVNFTHVTFLSSLSLEQDHARM